MEGHVFIGNNRSEDVNWLCSLSEAELVGLDLLAIKNLLQFGGSLRGYMEVTLECCTKDWRRNFADFLISLKKFAQERSKVIRHESLAKKIDLKMLRAYVSFIGQCVKGTPKEFQMTEAGPSEEVLDGCNLFKWNQEYSVPDIKSEGLKQYMEIGKRRQARERLSEVAPGRERQK